MCSDDSKKLKSIKEQEASGLVSSSSFIMSIQQNDTTYKMNEIVNKFLLTGDKFMTDMHLRQPGFSYNACGQFTENKEKIEKFKETGDSRYFYQKELDKTCFQHDMAYGDFKDLTRRTTSDEILRGKAFNIAKNPKYDGYQRRLASWFTNSLIKKLLVAVLKMRILQTKIYLLQIIFEVLILLICN